MTCKEDCTCPNCVLDKISGKKQKISKCLRCGVKHNPDEKSKCLLNQLRKSGANMFDPSIFNPYLAFDPTTYEKISKKSKKQTYEWKRYTGD